MASQIQAPYLMQFGEPPYYPYTHLSSAMSSSQYVPGIYASTSPAKSSVTAPSAPTKQIHRNRASYSCHCCRRRKVKCDQVHPTCGNCKKHGDQCQYNDNSHVKSKKKDGVKKASSSDHSASMSSSRSKQSVYDSATSSLLASPSFSEYPSVTPIASASYVSSQSAYLQPGTPVASSSYPSPQAYSPGSYYSDYSATSPSQSATYYDYSPYSTSSYTSSIPAAVDPMYPPSSAYEDPSSYAYSSAAGDSSYSYYPAASGI